MTTMTSIERSKRLKALGYRMIRGYFCPIRQKKMPYATVPDNMPGSTCVHENLEGVESRILNAEKIRSWQSEPIERPEEEVSNG